MYSRSLGSVPCQLTTGPLEEYTFFNSKQEKKPVDNCQLDTKNLCSRIEGEAAAAKAKATWRQVARKIEEWRRRRKPEHEHKSLLQQ